MTKDINIQDEDAIETQEWLEALRSVIDREGADRARFLIKALIADARKLGAELPFGLNTSYANTIPAADEPAYPGDLNLENRISALIRWNAVAMVVRAVRQAKELGGHIATYASAATLYDVGFNHFFHAPSQHHGGDLVYIQGHASPGIYARAYLEGRFNDEQLGHFRQEVEADGLSSYPHSWLMPDFWQFATVSMGLGPMQAIYAARFLKYLQGRKLIDTEQRKIWAFCGDGEMDEPESLGAISLAGREKLDNLIFVINCNLQRLDGPVRGNSSIIQELESVFRGAGWNVIKVLWGNRWDPLFAKDSKGLLVKRMEECVDGDYQNFKARDGAYVREHFFGKYPELKEMVANMSDDEIWRLNRGGHDPRKVYAAYHAACKHKGQPTVILAKTVKGYGMGAAGEALNITHQQKKMSGDELKLFVKRFDIPVSEDKAEAAPFYRPDEKSEEINYIKKCREALGGFLPARQHDPEPLPIPPLEDFATLLKGTGDRHISTTMVFVRFLTILARNKEIGKYVVPIVPDESRTFGMEGLFRQLGIYTPAGQLYKPVDVEQIMSYHESKDGHILQEGINEAGALCSWIAAGTSYSHSHLSMIPFYIFYSMFGFQRVGDFTWAAGDMQAQGFLLGGTAGRTTLAGEGLQHQDGHSHILASTIPNCRAYDPCFGYELVVIMHDGLKRMYEKQERIYYYITVMNENYEHPELPKDIEDDIIKGMYLLKKAKANAKAAKEKRLKSVTVQLLGSGTILNEVIAASQVLAEDYGIHCHVWSVTSFNELRREAQAIAREAMLNPDKKSQQSHVDKCLGKEEGPIIAATDYMRLYADQIRPYIRQTYTVLGTDGYGRSDTRKKLRHFFEVDCKHIVYATLKTLTDEGKFPKTQLKTALKDLNINPKKPNPATV